MAAPQHRGNVAESADRTIGGVAALTDAASAAVHLSPPNYAFVPVPTKASAMLDTGELPKITLVRAPPGYGKTILLAETFTRLAAAGDVCFWIGIDAHDGGRASVLDALERAIGIGRDNVPEAMDYRVALSTRERIGVLLQKLAAYDRPVRVFIDNVDLGNVAHGRELLNELVFSTAAKCSVVASCSTEAPFDTTRAMLELRMRTIGPAELEFAAEQVVSLFADAGVTAIADRTVQHILAQSDGWPAAIRLMQVLASATSDVQRLDHSFPTEGERLVDALFEDLFDRLHPDLRQFLLNISAFSSFSSDLLSFATQSDKAGEFLRYLVDKKILIVSLDAEGQWFRLHTLFRKYLVRRVARDTVETDHRAVTRRGAQWLERHDRIEPSLELAMQARDESTSVRLLEKLSWSLVRSRGYLPTFIVWAEKVKLLAGTLGDEASFWLAWALIFERRYEEAVRAIAELRDQIETRAFSADHKQRFRAKAGLAEIVLMLHMDDLKSVQALAPGWLDQYAGTDPFEHGAAAGALALAQLADHQFAAARSSARTSMSAVAPTSSIYGQGWASNISALIAVATCNSDRVEEALAGLEQQIRAGVNEDALIAAVTSTVRARALYDRGQVKEATALAMRALPAVRGCGMLDFVWTGYEVLVPAMLFGDDDGEGDMIDMAELRQIAAVYPKRLSVLLDLALIRLQCNLGQVPQAQELGERLGIWSADRTFSLPDDFTLECERAAANLAGIALMTAHGNLRAADDLIEGELANARHKSRRGAVVELHLAQAAVEQKRGQQRMAIRALSRAFSLAAECRSVRPFFEQRPLVAHLLSATSLKELALATDAGRAIFEEVGRLVKAAEPSDGAASPPPVSDALTKRELELLRMLDAGLDNAQISGSSGISVRTVKWHLHNLYAKLDVKNRTSALARARQLQLI